MNKEDAELPDAFIDLMTKEQLEIQEPGEDDNPWFDGFVAFSAFVFFGASPLLSYAISLEVLDGKTTTSSSRLALCPQSCSFSSGR